MPSVSPVPALANLNFDRDVRLLKHYLLEKSKPIILGQTAQAKLKHLFETFPEHWKKFMTHMRSWACTIQAVRIENTEDYTPSVIIDLHIHDQWTFYIR